MGKSKTILLRARPRVVEGNEAVDIGRGCAVLSGGCLITVVVIAAAIGVGALIVKFFWNLI